MDETTRLERQKFVENLKNYVKSVNERLKNLCDSLGYEFEPPPPKEPHVACPFNDGHRVPERTIEKHLQSCEWKTLGYTKECVPLPESCIPPDNPSTIKFDMELQRKVLLAAKEKNPDSNIGTAERFLPQTSDRLVSDFTRDERLAMYEYVIAHTEAPDIGKDISDLNKPKKPNDEPSDTMLELIAQERNLKRRRVRYKGVHTNKKSHTEIMKELIEQQMEMFSEHLQEKFGIPTPNDNKEIDSCQKMRAVGDQLIAGSKDLQHNNDVGYSTEDRKSYKSYDKEGTNYKHKDYKISRISRESSRNRDHCEKDHEKHRYNSRRYDSRDRKWNEHESSERKIYQERSRPSTPNNDQIEFPKKNRDHSRSRKRDHKSIRDDNRHNDINDYKHKDKSSNNQIEPPKWNRDHSHSRKRDRKDTRDENYYDETNDYKHRDKSRDKKYDWDDKNCDSFEIENRSDNDLTDDDKRYKSTSRKKKRARSHSQDDTQGSHSHLTSSQGGNCDDDSSNNKTKKSKSTHSSRTRDRKNTEDKNPKDKYDLHDDTNEGRTKHHKKHHKHKHHKHRGRSKS